MAKEEMERPREEKQIALRKERRLNRRRGMMTKRIVRVVPPPLPTLSTLARTGDLI
jgi:hypothetical protein